MLFKEIIAVYSEKKYETRNIYGRDKVTKN
jgi:hypothetical protein